MLRPEEMDMEQLASRLAAVGRDEMNVDATARGHADGPTTRGPAQRVEEIRALLETTIEAVSRELRMVLQQTDGTLAERERRALLAQVVRPYTMADIGKGFSVLVHTLRNILEEPGGHLDANGLRLFRDTLERLYGDPCMSHESAWALRKDLKRVGFQVQDRDLRAWLVDAITSDGAEDGRSEG